MADETQATVAQIYPLSSVEKQTLCHILSCCFFFHVYISIEKFMTTYM
ncbi:rCG32382 [Rattus norvegicus]|uniref:RCG32382 n=1 Tax=Rattus norvegicus TaxID=10116 RepID=A6JXR8_RAT|nr:rCG32382 [Rattus norvegicus]